MYRSIGPCVALVVALVIGCGTGSTGGSSSGANKPKTGGENTGGESRGGSTDKNGGRSSITNGAAAADDVKLQILDYDGLVKLIESHQGKIVVVDVWSTSCPPCLKEFPGLVALHKAHSRNDVICVSLSLDYAGIQSKPPESYEPAVLGFLKSQGATFDNVLAGEDADTMLAKLKLSAPPAVYVYHRDGTLAKRFDNEQAASEDDAFTYQDVSALVDELLKDEPEAPNEPEA